MEVTADIVKHQCHRHGKLTPKWHGRRCMVRPQRAKETTTVPGLRPLASRVTGQKGTFFSESDVRCYVSDRLLKNMTQTGPCSISRIKPFLRILSSLHVFVCGGLYAFAFYKEAVSCCLWGFQFRVVRNAVDSGETRGQVRLEATICEATSKPKQFI